MVDVAHNPHAFQNLLKILTEQYPYKKKVFILGMLKRKNIVDVLRLLRGTAEYIYAVDLPTQEAFSAQYIASLGQLSGLSNIEAYSSVAKAYTAAKKQAQKKDTIIVVAGSFYTVGEFFKKKSK
jgi:dihydrofolate synthase/folylpolyglutamate synthase